LPVLELLPDGSYRSALIWPKASPEAAPGAAPAARRGEDLPVRGIQYEIPDRDGDGKDELIALVTIIDRRWVADPAFSLTNATSRSSA
jgi:hypothetical protein